MRPIEDLDAEATRLERAADDVLYDDDSLGVAAHVLRDRMSPGQVQTRYGNSSRSDFDAGLASANWACGLTDTKPSEVLR